MEFGSGILDEGLCLVSFQFQGTNPLQRNSRFRVSWELSVADIFHCVQRLCDRPDSAPLLPRMVDWAADKF